MEKQAEPAYQPFEGGSVPRTRKKANSRWLSPGRFCLAFCALIGSLIALATTYGVYKAAKDGWKMLSNPHGHVRANASLVAVDGPIPDRDTDVVRSFFGPQAAGGVDHFDLQAAIWAKVQRGDANWTSKSHTPWELVWDAIVLNNVPIDAKAQRTVQQVRLPQEFTKELAESFKVNVWATFAMLPSADRIDATLSHHTWRTSRNASIFGTTSRYPPLTVEMQTPPRDVFPRFLANSGTARQLLAEPPSRFKTANGTRIDPSVAPRRIETHSRVTMVRDNYPVYNFTVYNRTLVARADMMRQVCSDVLAGGVSLSNPDHRCDRTFHNAGHFENMIEFDDAVDDKVETARRVGWRYGPFLTGRFGSPGPLDQKALYGNETEGPARLAAGTTFLTGLYSPDFSSPHNMTAFDAAEGQDFFEAFRIALPTLVLPSSLALVRMINQWLSDRERFSTWDMWMAVTITYNFLACAAQLSLLCRIEWQWGGPLGWVPVGLSRRKATHSERASTRADAKFDWRLRIALGVGAVLFSRFGPPLPPLLRGSAPKQARDVEYLRKHVKTLNPLRSMHVMNGLRVVEDLSQLHLCYRLGVFASQYRPTIFLVLLNTLLELVPRFIWDWHSRPPVSYVEVAAMVCEGAMCYAAWKFPTVSQEEEEEE
ncbi:hypothetical protein JCM8202v2_002469 [Rhodotorula sphaerocarpa]